MYFWGNWKVMEATSITRIKDLICVGGKREKQAAPYRGLWKILFSRMVTGDPHSV
jgi:hypothetical protein